MARRKAYAGTPEQHRENAAGYIKSLRRAVAAARKATNEGKCESASFFLNSANFAAGAFTANVQGARRKTRGSREKTLKAAQERFTRKCLR
jgi:hypothetical protein